MRQSLVTEPEAGDAVQNASHDGLIDDLYHAHYAAVLRVCSSILRNPEDAAEAAQDVFLTAIESLDRTSRGMARPWLLTVARNHCLDLLRRRKRLGKALVTLGSRARGSTDLESAVADRDFVGTVFKQLSTRERQALWHSAVESRPLADIAGRLRLSYMAAAQVLHRARRHAGQVAARVAVVVGIVHLGRQRFGGSLQFARIAAVASVPLIAVSLQSSSPTREPAPVAPAPVSAAAPTLTRASPTTPTLQASATTSPLPSGVFPSPLVGGPGGGTLKSAIDVIHQLIGPLPLVRPVISAPPTLPSVPPVPLPTPLPGLP